VHSPYFAARARRALGAVEWAAGDARAALEALGPNEELLLRGIRTTAARASEPDLVEALAASGELERARALVERIPPTPSAGARARALRLDGTVAAAEGRLDDAVASLTESLALAAALSAPFERARTELALGSALRRAKRRREARERLESAAAAFEVMGSAAGAAQARAELERIGGRAPSRDALTTAERRVAELAAAGKTNKEVAAALYVSVRTVEAALTRAYGKLGVRSRTELANRLST
jgi:DNA-binding CsgD family transcriptional regulator